MHPLAHALLCLALPWIWGALVAAVYARRDRRPPAALRGQPPSDFSI